ncbi:expressed protein [Phakopsora pachyrhizi]|uniref:Expressed protein n=1 Tax=Phakopsora pachyrhizi TaxID=170000 RepID=A0AAV0BT98_PHAPC|nr:expressed protein [Phakopsora pachyrhizi]CAH7689442.1 expressed protein [Phakopsora pachyrhizi]
MPKEEKFNNIANSSTDQQHKTFYQTFFEGTQISSAILPIPILYQQFKNHSLNKKPEIQKLSYKNLITRSIKLNGFFSVGIGLTYASIIKSFDYLNKNYAKISKDQKFSEFSNQSQSKLPSPSLLSRFKILHSDLQLKINDYSIIGGTLGGLATLTVLYKNKSFLNILSIMPGGISLGIACGISTALIQST